VNAFRVFFVGGATSYRALFHWMNPWIFIPMLVVLPTTEMLFFAYLGRATHTRTDTYFVVGNALYAAALPGLFGMGHSISGERRSQTLAVLLASPANRFALFLGRTVPALANGILVSSFCFATGAVALKVDISAAAIPRLLAVGALCAFSCTALGLCVGAIGLRGRNVSVVADMLTGLLLLATGANVPVSRLPGWVQDIGALIPLTHGIRAARELTSGATLGAVGHLLALELITGLVYLAAGVALLRFFEYEGRRAASFETF
jgi:ABC-2 type transport system permease protein